MVEIVGSIVVRIGFVPRGMPSQQAAVRTALVPALTPQAMGPDPIAPARDRWREAR